MIVRYVHNQVKVDDWNESGTGRFGVSAARERRWREPGHRDAKKARGLGGQP